MRILKEENNGYLANQYRISTKLFCYLSDQNFYYENPSSGTMSPDQFKKYLATKKLEKVIMDSRNKEVKRGRNPLRKSFKNKCFKATESGLL